MSFAEPSAPRPTKAELAKKPVIEWTHEDWAAWIEETAASFEELPLPDPPPMEPVPRPPAPEPPPLEPVPRPPAPEPPPPEPVPRPPAPEPPPLEPVPEPPAPELVPEPKLRTEPLVPPAPLRPPVVTPPAVTPPAVTPPGPSSPQFRPAPLPPLRVERTRHARTIEDAGTRLRSAAGLLLLSVTAGALVAALITIAIFLAGVVLRRAVGA